MKSKLCFFCFFHSLFKNIMLTPGGICKIVGILLIVTAPLFQLWEFFCLFYFYLIFLDVLLHTGVWKPFFLPVKEKKKKR